MKLLIQIKPAAGIQIFCLAAGLLFILCSTGSAGQAGRLPFKAGETLEYSVSWERVPAGTARFEAREHTAVDGQKAWYFVLEARSNSFVDWFAKIRDRLESLADPSLERSLLYKKTQRGKSKKEVVVAFDWEKKTATYSNFGGKRPSIEIPDSAFDPLASFYKLRTLDLTGSQKDGDTEPLFFSVTDGKKCFTQEGKIMGTESITVAAGVYDTVLITPSVNHFSGVFSKSENPTVRVWVSTDDRQVPVRIKMKVFIGSLVFDLVSIQG